MPTGYTAKLVESGQPFPEFVMGCARAFGACLEMRDDSPDAPIPDEFKPSPYHTERLAECKAELESLHLMSTPERIAYGRGKRQKDIDSNRGYIKRTEEENTRIEEMEAQVTGWEPPSSEHQGLKTFMLQQLGISKGSTEYSKAGLAAAIAASPGKYYSQAVLSAEDSVKYHTTHLQDDEKRARGNTDWIKKLRASLAVAR